MVTAEKSFGKSSELVRGARRVLGFNQAELARLLRVSAKAVQSYEQGWRKPSQSVIMHLLTLLALKSGYSENKQTCWERRKCPPEIRDTCAAYRLNGGRFCWLAAGGCTAACSPGAQVFEGCLKCCVTAVFMKSRPG